MGGEDPQHVLRPLGGGKWAAERDPRRLQSELLHHLYWRSESLGEGGFGCWKENLSKPGHFVLVNQWGEGEEEGGEKKKVKRPRQVKFRARDLL